MPQRAPITSFNCNKRIPEPFGSGIFIGRNGAYTGLTNIKEMVSMCGLVIFWMVLCVFGKL